MASVVFLVSRVRVRVLVVAKRTVIENIEKAEVIRRSSSQCASPMFIVHKKYGSLRICIDYHLLQNRTVFDAHPLPRIEYALDALGGANTSASKNSKHLSWKSKWVNPGVSYAETLV